MILDLKGLGGGVILKHTIESFTFNIRSLPGTASTCGSDCLIVMTSHGNYQPSYEIGTPIRTASLFATYFQRTRTPSFCFSSPWVLSMAVNDGPSIKTECIHQHLHYDKGRTRCNLKWSCHCLNSLDRKILFNGPKVGLSTAEFNLYDRSS